MGRCGRDLPADHCGHQGPCWNQRQDLEDSEDSVGLAGAFVCHVVCSNRRFRTRDVWRWSERASERMDVDFVI